MLEIISTRSVPVRVDGLEVLLYQGEIDDAKKAHAYDMIYAIMHNVYTMGGGKSSSGKSYSEYAEEIDKAAWGKSVKTADVVNEIRGMFDKYGKKEGEESETV